MINQKQAQNIALQALVYISELPEERKKFLQNTGFDGSHIHTLVEDDHFLAGVIRFLREDDALLLTFSASRHVKPDAILQAQLQLEGASSCA